MGPRSWDRGEPYPVGGVRRARLLQWGRGLGTAERTPQTLEEQLAARLQWGRGLGTAESTEWVVYGALRVLASMGPRSWDRGEPRAKARRISPVSASMGPRSWDRGEMVDDSPSEPRTHVLQWGRGLGTAERQAYAAAPARKMGLQWGRGLGTAESRPPWNAGAGETFVSMGPGGWGRGESAA